MRLIDADALIKNYLDHCRTEFEIKNCCMADENVLAIIQNATTVDIPDLEEYEDMANALNMASELLHKKRQQGEWLHPYKTNIACECSVCNMQMPITDYFNFCPNCGADMRKGGAE